MLIAAPLFTAASSGWVSSQSPAPRRLVGRVQLQTAVRLGGLADDMSDDLAAMPARIAPRAPAAGRPSNHRVAAGVRDWAQLSPLTAAPVTHREHWGMTPAQCALLEQFSEKLRESSDYRTMVTRPAPAQRLLRMLAQMERFADARSRVFLQLEEALRACGDRTAMNDPAVARYGGELCALQALRRGIPSAHKC